MDAALAARRLSRLWPCQGLASLRPIRSAMVGATSSKVTIPSWRPARQPRVRADDQERGPERFAIEAVGADHAAMLAEIVAVVGVDDDQGALEPGLAAQRFDQLAHDVVGVADGVADALVDIGVAGDVELGLGRAERVVVAGRNQAGEERPAAAPSRGSAPRRGGRSRGRAGPPADSATAGRTCAGSRSCCCPCRCRRR